MANYTGANGRKFNDLSANTTLAQDTHAGVIQNIVADGKTITLPAAAAGLKFFVRNGGAPVSGGPAGTGSDASVAVTIAPNGTDTIGGAGRTSANTSLVNTKATAKVGDYVALLGASGKWVIVEQAGTWA